jgi:hypothetical protein
LIDRAHCALLPSSFSAAKKNQRETTERLWCIRLVFRFFHFFFLIIKRRKTGNSFIFLL